MRHRKVEGLCKTSLLLMHSTETTEPILFLTENYV
jgi:hypothetical protein